MSIKSLYKTLVPELLRRAISGNEFVQRQRANFLHWRRRKQGVVHVMFVEHLRGLWANHASVYEAMRADPAFNVTVVVIPKVHSSSPHMNMGEYRLLLAELRRKGVDCVEGYDAEHGYWYHPLKYGIPDICVLPQPYPPGPGSLFVHDYLKHYSKIVYVPYGVTLANLPQFQYWPAFCDTCWRIFAESEPHRALYKIHVPEAFDQVVVSGHPKMDAYLPGRTAASVAWKAPSAQKRIIWAPHFTVHETRTTHKFSTFFVYYEWFLDFARKHPEVEIMMRPHPELFGFLVVSGLKTQDEANTYRDRFNQLPNTWVYEGADIFDYFNMSDALILDSIGFIAEYLPTGRPICFLEGRSRNKLNEIGERILDVCYHAFAAEDIERFINEVVLQGRDSMQEARADVCRQVIYRPEGGVGKFIADYIRDHV